VNEDLGSEACKPVTLAGAGEMGRPSRPMDALADALSNVDDGGLEAAPISRGAHLDDQPALGTPVSPKPYMTRNSIEISDHKPVSPHPETTAPWATLRTGPGKVSSQLGY